jgi:Na+/melibiose symporter-like transporter
MNHAEDVIRSKENPVGVFVKVVYGVGAVSDSIKTFSFTTFMLFYYTTVLGLPGSLLGTAMAVGLLWDAVVDPLIGHLSDRAKIRFGRRHTFMLIGSVCAGVSFIAVFNPPPTLSSEWLFAWLMISSLLLRSSASLFMVPYSALGAELSSDYQGRTSIAGFRSAVVIAGTLIVIVAAFMVFLPPQPIGGIDAKFARESYTSMGVWFGVAMIVTGLVATFGTLGERPRIGAPPASDTGTFALRRTVIETLRDRSFRILMWSTGLSFTAAALNAALAMYFLTYHAQIAASQGFMWYFGAYFAGALLGVSVWVRVTRQFEKHHVYAATTLMTAIVMSAGYWLVGAGRPLGTGNLQALFIGNVLAGSFGVAAAVTVPSMLADITARDALLTGHRREGIFFGIQSFGQQLSGGLAVLVGGVLVDRFAGLVPAQIEQSAETVERLAMISNLLPSALFAAAGILALRYDLTRRDVQSIQESLATSRTARV